MPIRKPRPPRTPFSKLKGRFSLNVAGDRNPAVDETDPSYVPNGFGYKTVPIPHQREALRASAGKRAFGLFMSVGTGKTKVLIDTAAFLFQRRAIDRMLVLAPNGVHLVWPEEIDKHCPTWARPTVVTFKSSWTDKQRERVEEELRNAPPGLLIVAMNIESLSSLSGKAFVWAGRFLSGGPSLLVIDESQRIKTPGSVRTKAVYHLGALAPYRRIATGTEVTKGYEDLYAQFKFLDRAIIGQPTFTAYRSEHCLMGGFEGRSIVGYRGIPQLMQKIAPFIFTKRLEDAVDMPPRIYQRRIVELSPEQRRLYRALVDETLAEITAGVVLTEARAAVRLVRLRQIVSGFAVGTEEDPEGGDDRKILTRLPNPRMTALMDLVTEEVEGKFIVWAAFKEDVRWIMEEFQAAGISAVAVYGGQSDKQNQASRMAFRDPGIRALVATPETGGTGFTFNEARTAIYYSHSFNYEMRLQSEGRNYRIGQKFPVLYIDLLAAKTVDLSKLLPSRERKESMATLIKDPTRFRAILVEASQMLAGEV